MIELICKQYINSIIFCNAKKQIFSKNHLIMLDYVLQSMKKYYNNSRQTQCSFFKINL